MLVIILLKAVASILEGTAASIFRVEELFDPEDGDSRFITIYQTIWCHIREDIVPAMIILNLMIIV
jgi:hypothetical protein